MIRLNPDALAYNNRGVAHDRQGEFDKAILDFDEAIHLNADSHWLSPTGANPTARKATTPGPSPTPPKPSASTPIAHWRTSTVAMPTVIMRFRQCHR